MRKLLVTLGDAAGIGPEIIVKCLASLSLQSHAGDVDPVVVGECEILEETAKALGLNVRFCPDDSPRQGRVKVRSLGLLKQGDYELGKLSALCGNAAYHYFAHAVESCL